MVQFWHYCDDSVMILLWWFSPVMIEIVQICHDCDGSVLLWLWWFSYEIIVMIWFCLDCRVGNSLFCSKEQKEQPWANHYRRSLKKNDHEQIALVALYKRATMSESLSSLFKKERPWANRSCCSLQKSNVSKSLSLLFNKEQHEWLARDSSKLLTKNEQFMIVIIDVLY